MVRLGSSLDCRFLSAAADLRRYAFYQELAGS